MLKQVTLLAVVMAFLLPAMGDHPVHARGGNGGSTKPTTVLYVGYITHLQEVENGILITVGTSYYSVAANILIIPDTKVKYNGDSISAYDLELGDYVEVTALWPSKVALKVEATGAP